MAFMKNVNLIHGIHEKRTLESKQTRQIHAGTQTIAYSHPTLDHKTHHKRHVTSAAQQAIYKSPQTTTALEQCGNSTINT